jgi:hypothetical protein
VDAPPDLVITITDVRRAGYCASGAKRWFTDHGFDFRDVLKNGVSAEAMLATGDAMAERVVAGALRRG